MRYQKLLAESKEHLERLSSARNQTLSPFIFTAGAEWMLQRMNELDKKERMFNRFISYEKYGYFKYSVCLSVFLGVSVFFVSKSLFLFPLAIIIFYFFEIHFLFLFPLLIEGVRNPLTESTKMMYKIGIFSSFTIVLPIGIYMLLGLFNIRNPLQNWYIGCLSILILYRDERR